MKVYHYSDHRKWPQIKKGSWMSDHLPGLGANLRLGTREHESRNISGVFALLEPQPNIWMKNPHFLQIWKNLKYNIGSLLLEVEVNPEKDHDVFVADRGFMEGFLYTDKGSLPQKYLLEDRLSAERAYRQSLIPIKEYYRQKERLDFSLPEVVITNNVPLERISISSKQPFLEEDLITDPELMDQFESITELQQWCRKYREKHPEFNEFNSSGIERK